MWFFIVSHIYIYIRSIKRKWYDKKKERKQMENLINPLIKSDLLHILFHKSIDLN